MYVKVSVLVFGTKVPLIPTECCMILQNLHLKDKMLEYGFDTFQYPPLQYQSIYSEP